MPDTNRIGFHYFPDALHYRDTDLAAWLPELRALGASWLTLVAPADRAIPEAFIRGLMAANIQPVLHFHLPLDLSNRPAGLRPLFEAYARWGVRYAALFDRPNLRAAWPATAWAQKDLVERFLDLYLPLAYAALQAGLTPVFPPLEPGGDYWDTAFLRAALQSIQRRGYAPLLEKLVIGAYAWAGNRSLDWGTGGPERWPGARPYNTPAGEQDQRGFRIFDWYLTISQAVLRGPYRIILLGAGSRPGDRDDPTAPAIDNAAHARQNLTIARLMDGEAVETLEPIPAEVLACNFWLLTASPDSPYSPQAWFQPNGNTLPTVGAFRQRAASKPSTLAPRPSPLAASSALNPSFSPFQYPIEHYLLLPTYEWGVADWHLDVIRPFVKKYRPAIGFSVAEAAQAARVTVIGGEQSFPETTLEQLRTAGRRVERISGDGTEIATLLASL